MEIEVLVIGSGFSGLTAAIEAHNNGANVIIIEKMSAVGGNSIISDGGVAAPCTELQKKFNIEDSTELMYDDMLKAGLGLNQPELVRLVVDKANDAFVWTKDYLKIEYLDRVDRFGGHSVDRCYTAKNTSGTTIIRKMMDKIKELEIPIMLNMYFKEFMVNSEGKIEGIVARANYNYKDVDQGYDINIIVKKGVIITSGGFGADIDFRMKQDSRLDEKIDTTNKIFTTAEVLKETLRLGASPVQLSHIQLGPWASPDEKGYGNGPMFSEYIVFQYGIIINPLNGQRFVNELGDRKVVSDKMLEIGQPCIGIADSKAVIESGWNIDKALKTGVVREFYSLKSLCEYYKIPYKDLEETISGFNEGVKNNHDNSFNKSIMEKAAEIKEYPFYAIRLWPKVHYTMGGIRINTEGRVLDGGGKVIDKLFAAGEVVGGVHGASRLGSCSITECLVFGRIAGRNAVKYNY